MDHRPYEDWLLDDERLTPEQERNLHVHLRNCPECSALSRANLTLRSVAVTAPVPGFALRFQVHLAAERKIQRRRSAIGLFLLVLAGVGVLLWTAVPYLAYFMLEPWQIVLAGVNQVVYIAFTLRTISVLGNTLFNVFAAQVPTYVWVLSIALFGGLGFLWTFSIRRIGKTVQSAT